LFSLNPLFVYLSGAKAKVIWYFLKEN